MDGKPGDPADATTKPLYIPGVEIRRRYKVSNGTLQRWANEGLVGSVRLGQGKGKRLYKEDDLHKVISGFEPRTPATSSTEQGRCVCYARVSSVKQKEDLQRQINVLEQQYPDHEIIKDIGSGINWKRPGFISLLDRVMRGAVKEVVVSHKDRLCRFAFDLVKHVFENAGCKLVVHDETVRGSGCVGEFDGAEAELRDDLLAIVTVFVASNNGRRAAAHRRERRARGETEARATTKKTTTHEVERATGETDKTPASDARNDDVHQVHQVQNLSNAPTTGCLEGVDRCDSLDLQQSHGAAECQSWRQGNACVAATMGRDSGRDVERREERGATTVRKRSLRDTGFSTEGHCSGMCVAAEQGEDVETQLTVPPTKRHRCFDHLEKATTQL